MKKTELYFGLGNCQPGEFDSFVDQEITPLFPAGLTILEGRGQWKRRDSGKIEKEACAVVVLLWDGGHRGPHLALDSIREAFCARFVQEAVGRVDIDCEVSF